MSELQIFKPWTIVDGKCVVAPEAEWERLRRLAGPVLVDADMAAEWGLSPLQNQSGERMIQSYLGDFWDSFDEFCGRFEEYRDKQGYRPLVLDDVRRRLFEIIDAVKTPFIVPTSDAERLAKVMPEHSPRRQCPAGERDIYRTNLWPALIASTQAELDARLPALLEMPAAKRGLFLDGLREGVDLTKYDCDGHYDPRVHVGIDFVIVRGGSEPMHPDWVRSVCDQCQAAGVPFVFLGWGEWISEGEMPNA
jgi:hypothetical protein